MKKAAEMYLGLVQKEREDVGDMVICPCGEELWHHSCSKEFGKGTASKKNPAVTHIHTKKKKIQEP